VVRRAKKLLDAADFEGARDLLEDSAKNERLSKARKATRATLWALLGRARAEVGDTPGADAAFKVAVRLDRKVKLPPSTSPKILQGLERARAAARGSGGGARSESKATGSGATKPSAAKTPSRRAAKRGKARGAAATKSAPGAADPKGDAKSTGSSGSKPVPRKATRPPRSATKRPGRGPDAEPSRRRGRQPTRGSATKSAAGDATKSAGGSASKRGATKSADSSSKRGATKSAGSSATKSTRSSASRRGATESADSSASKRGATKSAGSSATKSTRRSASKRGTTKPAGGATKSKRDEARGPDASTGGVELSATASLSPPWLVGRPHSGATVVIVAAHAGLPADATIEAMIRRAQSGPFEARTMVRTSTVATRSLTVNRPRFEIYVRARSGETTIAIGGGPDRALVVTPESPPPMAQAWAESEPEPIAAVDTSTSAAPPPADGMSDGLFWGLIGGGAAVGLAAIVTLAVVFGAPGSGCDTAETLGCVEVEVLPLRSF